MAARLAEPAGPAEERDEEDGSELLTQRPSEALARSAPLLGRRGSAARKWLGKRFRAIAKGFEDQADRSNKLDDWWNTYNCIRDDNGYYSGEAQIYVPTIHDAVNAIVTRYSNQLMPQMGRYVEATPTDGQQPYEILALVNHYIGKKFKPLVLKPLLRNSLVEGQYNLYVDWQKISRQLVSRETRGVLTEGPQPGEQVESDAAPDEIVDIKEEDIEEGMPRFTVLHDADVLVLPSTADSIDQALEDGGSVTIVRRFSEEALKNLADEEDLDLSAGAANKDEKDSTGSPLIFSVTPEMIGIKDIAKHLARSVGVKARGRHAILFETWQKVPLSDKGSFDEDGEPRLCKCWYALNYEPLGFKRNPYWNDRCPLLSEPVEKESGVFKGKSQIEAIAELQYESNDAANERADVDHMSAMPIVVRKAEEGNAPLIIAKAAIWDYSGQQPPNIIEFPDLSARANSRVLAARQLIFQSMSVNPAMLPQQTGSGAKRNQAEVAMEQQVDMLTTAEGVDTADAMLTEMVERIVDLDHQFRDREVTVRRFGELGVEAEMVPISPMQNRTHYNFQWVGAVQMRMNVAMTQNGSAFINILRGMQDQLAKSGLELNLGGLLEYQASSIFGPTIARGLLRDLRHELGVDPGVENELMADGHEVPINMFDNDQLHLQSHQRAMQQNGDPHGTLRVHIQWHLKSMQQKMLAQQQSMMQAGAMPGVPGQPQGGRPGQGGGPPRIAGPQQGAVPAQPRQMKAPPGRIPATALPRGGAIVPPRRF